MQPFLYNIHDNFLKKYLCDPSKKTTKSLVLWMNLTSKN